MHALLIIILIVAGLAVFDLLTRTAGADSKWLKDDDHLPPPWL